MRIAVEFDSETKYFAWVIAMLRPPISSRTSWGSFLISGGFQSAIETKMKRSILMCDCKACTYQANWKRLSRERPLSANNHPFPGNHRARNLFPMRKKKHCNLRWIPRRTLWKGFTPRSEASPTTTSIGFSSIAFWRFKLKMANGAIARNHGEL